MPRVWVSVGSNIDREHHIRAALADLHMAFGDLTVSPLYETDAVGFEGDAFYNLVVGADTVVGLGMQEQVFVIGRPAEGAATP